MKTAGEQAKKGHLSHPPRDAGQRAVGMDKNEEGTSPEIPRGRIEKTRISK